MLNLTKAEYETIHPALFHFRPAGVGQHRIARTVLKKFDEIGAPFGPMDRVTGYTPMTCSNEVKLDLSSEGLIVTAIALEQGYEMGVYRLGISMDLPELIDRIRAASNQ